MTTNNAMTKVQVCLLFAKVRDGAFNVKEVPVYVGYTTRGTEAFERDCVSKIKLKDRNFSQKVAEAHMYVGNLHARRLTNCYMKDVAATVNLYILMHDTINNGLNTELRV